MQKAKFPTPDQVYYLAQGYYATLYDLDESLGWALPNDLCQRAAAQIPNRSEISEEIQNNNKTGKISHPAARKYLEEYFKEHNIKADF